MSQTHSIICKQVQLGLLQSLLECNKIFCKVPIAEPVFGLRVVRFDSLEDLLKAKKILSTKVYFKDINHHDNERSKHRF